MKPLKAITFFFTVLVIAFTPLDAIEISEGAGITPGRIFFVAMTLSAVLSDDLIIKRPVNINKVLILFILWAFMTTLWSVDMDVTLIRVLYLIQYLIIFAVMVNTLNTQKKLKIAMIGWIIGSAYIAVKTANNYSTFAHSAHGLYRVMEYGNPNENSFMLCYALVFCYLIDKTRLRLPSIIYTGFAVYAIVANGSRMGIILFTCAVAAFCIQLWQDKMRGYVFVIIPCIIVGGLYVLNHIPQATLMRILGITDDIEKGNFAHRENIWRATYLMLNDNPLWSYLGCGWGTFSIVIKDYLGYNKGAHNFYLDLISTTGIIGFTLVMYYLSCLYRIIKKTWKATFMNYLLLLLPMISMMSTNWQSRRWWFLMGAFIYMIYKTRNFTESDETRIIRG